LSSLWLLVPITQCCDLSTLFSHTS
jgi:hypothetical protein